MKSVEVTCGQHEDPRPHSWSMCAACLCSCISLSRATPLGLYFPVACNPSRAVISCHVQPLCCMLMFLCFSVTCNPHSKGISLRESTSLATPSTKPQTLEPHLRERIDKLLSSHQHHSRAVLSRGGTAEQRRSDLRARPRSGMWRRAPLRIRLLSP